MKSAHVLVVLAVATTVSNLSAAPYVAVYGAHNIIGLGSPLQIYDQAGNELDSMLFRNSAAPLSSYGINLNIEDIAADRQGNIYAVGKPNGEDLRTIFKSDATKDEMEFLFQTPRPYDASVDGSIAVSQTGNIAVYGAHNVIGLGSSLSIYDQSGNLLHDMLFRNLASEPSYGINLNIEDVAFDRQGNVYAIGKPNGEDLRTIFKSDAGLMEMEFLFQTPLPYDALVDGSIAVFVPEPPSMLLLVVVTVGFRLTRTGRRFPPSA
jgi:hypothetical protein